MHVLPFVSYGFFQIFFFFFFVRALLPLWRMFLSRDIASSSAEFSQFHSAKRLAHPGHSLIGKGILIFPSHSLEADTEFWQMLLSEPILLVSLFVFFCLASLFFTFPM